MTDNKIYHQIENLRDPKQLAFLETKKVVQLCLDGIYPQKVLDVGSGSGIFAEIFDQKGFKVTGVDIQEAMLEAAARRVQSIAL